MLSKSNLEKTPEFLELKTYLDAEIQKHKDKIQAFASNSDAYVFLSTEEEQQENAKKII
jgi:3-methyladenine DNA glycosylase Tag